MILDGGSCAVGVELTILDVTGKNTVLLRAGGTTLEEIEDFFQMKKCWFLTASRIGRVRRENCCAIMRRGISFVSMRKRRKTMSFISASAAATAI